MSSKKCNVNCCVYGCHTKKGRERHLSFHRFPTAESGYVYLTNKFGIQEKVDKKKAWEKVLLMEKPASSTVRVCSLHFLKENFILPDFPTKIPRLKKDAVPTQNLPKKSIVTAEPSSSRRNKSCNISEQREEAPVKKVALMDVLHVEKNIVKQEITYDEPTDNITYDDLQKIKKEHTFQTQDETENIASELCEIPIQTIAIKVEKEDTEPNSPIIEELYIKDEVFTAGVFEEAFNCKMCEKKFMQQNELTNHIRSHTGEKPFECKLCPKKFSLKVSLHRHMKIHIGLTSFKCKTCSNRYSQKSHLEEHIKTHTGEKPFGCKLCPKKFIKKSNLKQHMKVHTGEKPFTCKTCLRQFSLKCHLNEHVLIHNGEKPFECETCAKKFSRKSTLKKHLKTHTGERPFECEVCAMRFSQRSSLQRHIKAHAGKE